jgi:hypothetical protein
MLYFFPCSVGLHDLRLQEYPSLGKLCTIDVYLLVALYAENHFEGKSEIRISPFRSKLYVLSLFASM